MNRRSKICRILYQNKDLFAEPFESISEYFILMENGKKPATELEIHAHCTIPVAITREEITEKIKYCRTVGCENCRYVIMEIIAQEILL